MSKKLSLNEELDSLEAVREFKEDCIGERGYEVKNANVIVLESDEIDKDNALHNIYVDVYIKIQVNHHEVQIMWEQALGDFKKKDAYIYGSYSTAYQNMEYSYKELTIFSDERTIIIRA